MAFEKEYLLKKEDIHWPRTLKEIQAKMGKYVDWPKTDHVLYNYCPVCLGIKTYSVSRDEKRDYCKCKRKFFVK